MSDPRIQIKGQKMHRDLKRGFSFWRPLNWRQGDIPSQQGVVYYPEEDPRTGFYVLVHDLGDGLSEPISPADLPSIREGLVQGLLEMPDCSILRETEIAKESAIGFEFLVSFGLDGEPCKRCMRVLYKDQLQVTIYGQGVPPADYDLFENTFDWMYMTFTYSDLMVKLLGMYPDPPPNTPSLGV